MKLRTKVEIEAGRQTRDVTRDIGAEIRRQREDAGIGQATLARRAGISPAYLSMIEAGTAMPALAVLARRRGARRPTGRSTGSRNRSGHQGSDPGTDGGGFPGNASPQMAALSRGTRVSARARRDRCRASRSGRTHRSRHRVPVPDPPTGAADALVDREGCRTGVGGKPGPTRPAGQCPRLAPVGAAVDGAQSAAGP